MKKMGIIGFGRFGELLADLSKDMFDVYIVENSPEATRLAEAKGYSVVPLNELAAMDFIFLAVPISITEEIIQNLAPIVTDQQVVVDVCSVKVYLAELMKKHLSHTQLLASHPMFGPDSAKRGLEGLQVAFCPIRIQSENEQLIRDLWESKGVIVVDTTPEKHDKDAVYSMALTYSIAKIILNVKLPEVEFTTRSFNAIKEIAAISANDSEQLFHDMLFYNPYYIEMKKELDAAVEVTKEKLNEIESEKQST